MNQDAEETQTDETTDIAIAEDEQSVAEVDPLAPYGIQVPSTGVPVMPAEDKGLQFTGEVQFTLQVSYIDKAEAFYHDMFAMDVVLRAWDRDGEWEVTTEQIDWPSLMLYGEYPGLVYLRRPGWSIILIAVGRGHILTSPKRGDAEVPIAPESLRRLRGRVLMKGHTVIEDTSEAFTFRDPFAVVWRLVADESLAS